MIGEHTVAGQIGAEKGEKKREDEKEEDERKKENGE